MKLRDPEGTQPGVGVLNRYDRVLEGLRGHNLAWQEGVLWADPTQLCRGQNKAWPALGDLRGGGPILGDLVDVWSLKSNSRSTGNRSTRRPLWHSPPLLLSWRLGGS